MIAFLVMNVTINALLQIDGTVLADGTISEDVLSGTVASVLGIQTLQMGVFGGIIVGLGVAALHNKYYKITLPNALSFFGGSRFVPIISTLVYVGVGILLFFVWPFVQNGIYALGGLVTGTGYFGTLIFGIYQACSDSIWPASCILSSVLADCCGRNNGSSRTACTGRTEYFLCPTGRSKHRTFQCGRNEIFLG